jgi:hypothetical protein
MEQELVYPEKIGSKYFITAPETGERLELKGYGSMKGMLDLNPCIDLTKPIWEQVFGNGRNPFASEEASDGENANAE